MPMMTPIPERIVLAIDVMTLFIHLRLKALKVLNEFFKIMYEHPDVIRLNGPIESQPLRCRTTSGGGFAHFY